ncbi:Protein of unknown function DUF1685 [Macleaya cordata]|uniref:DUF1685 domain-containing protein n=1 Tax=Macleaya cordata TaxID=56857 RepID=A0A200QXG5_MACCD|nr:Protein of unknown function DUF1685 [Macleaya cordata]
MDAEELLNLFDSYWFYNEILINPPLIPSFLTNTVLQIPNKPLKPEISRLQTSLLRSVSDDLTSQTSFSSDSVSPNSVLRPKLKTINSGKEDSEENPKQERVERPSNKDLRGRRMKKMKSNKSLSDLEFEELKGFMDLGFVFSEEDKNSSLVSIIPGLQRLGKKDDGVEKEIIDEPANIHRPYLSEAWGVLEKRREEKPLMNWKVPTLDSEIAMKDHLRNWAHSVASAVR